jgi:hypothetical protein
MDHFIYHVDLRNLNPYGFKTTFNATHPDRCNNPSGWVSPWKDRLHQGPSALMAENYRNFFWRLIIAACFQAPRFHHDGLEAIKFV